MCCGPEYDVIVIIVADAIAPLDVCLASLIADAAHAEASGRLRTHVCVVDNASPDHVFDWATEHYPDTSRIRTTETVSYAQARNEGLALARWSDAPYFLLLDPATQFPAGLISGLVEAMRRHDDLGLIEPLQHVYTPGNLTLGEYNARSTEVLALHSRRQGHERGQTTTAPGPNTRTRTGPDTIEDVSLDGHALLGRMAVLDRTGLLDEAYQTDYAVDDLLRSARLDGWRTAVLTEIGIQLREPEGADGREIDAAEARDELYYLACHPIPRGISPWTALADQGWFWRELITALRTRPRDTTAAILTTLGSYAWLAWHWPRVLGRRRALRQMERHPTWNRATAPEPDRENAHP
jgi:hypothetical protein